jgi:ribosome biogenesis GTPase
MKLEDLGYTADLEKYRKDHDLTSFDIARVISEHKERYIVKTADKEYEAEIIGNLRYTAENRSDFPAVGDWVAISEYDEEKVLIHHVFPRKTIIERQAVGKQGEKQIIATNIDYAFIVQAVDRDYNINRIERYLTICHTSQVSPIIILNKIDLIDQAEMEKILLDVKERIRQVPVIAISNETHVGIEEVKSMIEKGKTYCLLGSSGVGKSTLLNNLSGKQLMETNTISSSTNRGKHVTTHRELIALESGGLLIDNPGMREVGIADSTSGLEVTFDTIFQLSNECKFKDCTHSQEVGCAVLLAIENGDLDEDAYHNYLKMEREKDHFKSTIAERRKKDKDFGKMIKQVLKNKKHTKF